MEGKRGSIGDTSNGRGIYNQQVGGECAMIKENIPFSKLTWKLKMTILTRQSALNDGFLWIFHF